MKSLSRAAAVKGSFRASMVLNHEPVMYIACESSVRGIPDCKF